MHVGQFGKLSFGLRVDGFLGRFDFLLKFEGFHQEIFLFPGNLGGAGHDCLHLFTDYLGMLFRTDDEKPYRPRRGGFATGHTVGSECGELSDVPILQGEESGIEWELKASLGNRAVAFGLVVEGAFDEQVASANCLQFEQGLVDPEVVPGLNDESFCLQEQNRRFRWNLPEIDLRRGVFTGDQFDRVGELGFELVGVNETELGKFSLLDVFQAHGEGAFGKLGGVCLSFGGSHHHGDGPAGFSAKGKGGSFGEGYRAIH